MQGSLEDSIENILDYEERVCAGTNISFTNTPNHFEKILNTVQTESTVRECVRNAKENNVLDLGSFSVYADDGL